MEAASVEVNMGFATIATLDVTRLSFKIKNSDQFCIVKTKGIYGGQLDLCNNCNP